MPTASPIVSTAPISVTMTKPGSNAQKAGPKDRSKPGQPPAGAPIHAAAATCSKS